MIRPAPLHARLLPPSQRDARHVNPYYTNVVSDRARSSKRQLGHLKETHNLLKAARIPHWLAGGWANVVLVGRATRHHRHGDVPNCKADWPPAVGLLLAPQVTLMAHTI